MYILPQVCQSDTHYYGKRRQGTMKMLGTLGLIAIFGAMMASIVISTSLITTASAKPLTPPLDAADLNNSGNVTLADLTGFASIYGWNSTNLGWNSPIHPTWRNASAADFNNDGKIDLSDLVTFAYAYWYNSTA
jgi:hypothetical protein